MANNTRHPKVNPARRARRSRQEGPQLPYPVTLTPDDNDAILVTFPDVPQAITFGDTVEEALERA
jgi:hypothetical protein